MLCAQYKVYFCSGKFQWSALLVPRSAFIILFFFFFALKHEIISPTHAHTSTSCRAEGQPYFRVGYSLPPTKTTNPMSIDWATKFSDRKAFSRQFTWRITSCVKKPSKYCSVGKVRNRLEIEGREREWRTGERKITTTTKCSSHPSYFGGSLNLRIFFFCLAFRSWA